MLAGLQRRLTYLPTGGVPPVEAVLPDGEVARFTTADGLELDAWVLAPSRDGQASDRNDETSGGPAALVFHGNGGNRADRAPLARALTGLGLVVMLVDYRGYGGNPGRPHEQGLYADARGARGTLVDRDDVDGDRIVYFGESLGAGVAVELALDHPPAAVILRSPFTSLVDVARTHYPFVPGALLHERYPSIERIPDIDAPVLVAAGENDRIVPFAQSRRLYEAATEPKQLLAVPGADHNDLALFTGQRLLDAIEDFLRQHRVISAGGASAHERDDRSEP